MARGGSRSVPNEVEKGSLLVVTFVQLQISVVIFEELSYITYLYLVYIR